MCIRDRVWINGGSDMDVVNKKGINQILSSLLLRGCKGFENLAFSEYIDSHGAELNHETLEDGILISLKSFLKKVDISPNRFKKSILSP